MNVGLAGAIFTEVGKFRRRKSCLTSRHLLSAIAAGTLLLASGFEALAGHTCENVFESIERLQTQPNGGFDVEHINLRNWRIFQTRKHFVVSGKPLVARNIVFESEVSGSVHRVSVNYISQVTHSSGDRLSSPIVALTEFNIAKNRALDFALGEYASRRVQWPTSFSTKLTQVSKMFELNSTYINVDHQANARAPVLGGTIRLITEKDGFTPMEDYLGITFRTSVENLKVEPGNFAIRAEANEVVWLEIGAHLNAQIKRLRDEFSREPVFVTYADRSSERMYRKLGFKPVPESMFELREPVEVRNRKDGAVVFKRDEVEWLPMYISATSFERHMRGKTLAPSSDRMVGKKKMLSEMYDGDRNYKLQEDLKRLEGIARIGTLSDIRMFKSTNRNSRSLVNVLIGSRTDGKSEIFIRHLGSVSIGLFSWGKTVKIPVKELYEGWNHSERVEPNSDLLMRYRSGVLEITQSWVTSNGEKLKQIYSLRIDENLRSVQQLTNTWVGPERVTPVRFELSPGID